MKKPLLTAAATAAFAVLGATIATAAIVPFTETFPTAGGVPAGWTAFVGAGGTLPTLGNNTGNTQKDDDGTEFVAGASLDDKLDGSLLINSQSASPAVDMGAFFNAGGTMALGEQYTLQTRIFSPNSSFISARVTLENATDSVVLAVSGPNTLNGPNGHYRTLVLNYTALMSDVGDTLRLRFAGVLVDSTARDLNIDNLRLSVVPEPGSLALVALGGILLSIRRRR